MVVDKRIISCDRKKILEGSAFRSEGAKLRGRKYRNRKPFSVIHPMVPGVDQVQAPPPLAGCILVVKTLKCQRQMEMKQSAAFSFDL